MFHFERKEYLIDSNHVVLVFSGWGNPQWLMWPIAKILNFHGFSAITYTYDLSILSPDVEKTLENFRVVEKDALETIKKLNSTQNTISIIGMSLGTMLAFMVANKEKQIHKVIANLTGADTAEVVWTWDKINQGFKTKLQKQTTLEELKKLWKPISPASNLSNFSDKNLLLYFAKSDEVIPFAQSKKLQKKLDEDKISYKIQINKHLRHLPAATKNMLLLRKYIHFLKA